MTAQIRLEIIDSNQFDYLGENQLAVIRGRTAVGGSAGGLRPDFINKFPDALISQVVECSLQPHIAKSVDDAGRRFGSESDVRDRLARPGDDYYMLVRGQRLGGVIWYGHRPPPKEGERAMKDATHTFAVRMYEECLGQNLASEFVTATLVDFKIQHDDVRKVWLSTDADNNPARSLYARTGWEHIMIDDNRREFWLRCLNRAIRK